jgi:predicted nucleic acid-binding protein
MSADKTRAFADTNVFIYLYSGNELDNRLRALDAKLFSTFNPNTIRMVL